MRVKTGHLRLPDANRPGFRGFIGWGRLFDRSHPHTSVIIAEIARSGARGTQIWLFRGSGRGTSQEFDQFGLLKCSRILRCVSHHVREEIGKRAGLAPSSNREGDDGIALIRWRLRFHLDNLSKFFPHALAIPRSSVYISINMILRYSVKYALNDQGGTGNDERTRQGGTEDGELRV